ncbi:s1/P1 nuclease domain-containing protein [Rhizoctonia solani AG-1 IA]|uniref:S1/P1 nuclease domain-containing protein n=1 Tax=Thanatephorus cucumeris (strain AG1-IA) TaxID=983506 RepID=L8WNR4_THACA|nr:s1/P1 nuclease domain-containing protein [Rhizoctonia solani AG-1 IA]
MTRNIQPSSSVDRDISLRFLTHFLGDIHQPFHGAGLFKGANNSVFRLPINSLSWVRLICILYFILLIDTDVHAVWDDFLILKRINLLTNYTSPLPTNLSLTLSPSVLALNRRIESALTGSNYDPLVRWIVLEGIYGWWGIEHQDWAICPQYKGGREISQLVLGFEPPFEDPTDLPVCPYYWATPTHEMLCGFIWRSDFKGVEDMKDAEYTVQLNGTEYTGRIHDEKLVEKQLALGGIRLAGIINEVLATEEEKLEFGVLPSLSASVVDGNFLTLRNGYTLTSVKGDFVHNYNNPPTNTCLWLHGAMWDVFNLKPLNLPQRRGSPHWATTRLQLVSIVLFEQIRPRQVPIDFTN